MPTLECRPLLRVVGHLSQTDGAASSGGRCPTNGTKLPDQTIGLRFNGLNIPQGAVIVHAYIQFQADEVDTRATTLQIHGEDTDNAEAFANTAFDVSSRLLTATDATVTWTPPAWTTVGAAGAEQQTSDISSIIQEIVSRPGWSTTSSIALIITGSGERTADSFDGNAAAAPLLHVEHIPPGLLNGLSSNDQIIDFIAGQGTDDWIDRPAFGLSGFYEVLSRATDIGANVAIDPDNGDNITLIGVQEAQLHQTDFFFG